MESCSLDLRAILACTSIIVCGYVKNNSIAVRDLPTLITSVYNTLYNLAFTEFGVMGKHPIVAAEKSVTQDHLICLEDGKCLQTLKRHLRSAHGLSPEEYRAKWRLSPNYPMIAPRFAARRSDSAKKNGLGGFGRSAQRYTRD